VELCEKNDLAMEIDRVEKLHTIGYNLKDAKVTLNQDIKFNVAGIKIEGAQSEVLNLPQWIGKTLSDNGLGTLETPDMVTELKQALSKEKMVGEYQLSTLDPHFYIKLKQSMRELGRDDFDHVESIMLELFRMRRGKLVKLADSIKLTSELYNKLTVEEVVFFRSIYDNSQEFEKQIRGRRNE
jgi:DNA replication factor GINS